VRTADFRSTPVNGHRQVGPAGPFRANGLNRSRGRALRHGRASNGWNDERVLPDDEEGPEACPRNRRLFSLMIARYIVDGVGERTERSEPTSASRTGSNTQTDAIGDAVMIASDV
jgi:hypothetical protein